MLDVASIHPDLYAGDRPTSYFRECAQVRGDLKLQLAEVLQADGFHLYMLPSTSSALATILLAASQAGFQFTRSEPDRQHYQPFLPFFSGPPRTGAPTLTFRTHVSPTTGRVDEIAASGPAIVDGAQSLGTCLTQALLDKAEVALAPLHKHLGLGVGIAVVMVQSSSPLAETFGQTLGLVEGGAQSLCVLSDARRRLSESGGAVFNKATIVIDAAVHTACERLGLRVLGSSGPPFACVTTLDGSDIAQRLTPGSWRHFKDFNVGRLSFDRRGRREASPVDCTEMLIDRLRYLAGG